MLRPGLQPADHRGQQAFPTGTVLRLRLQIGFTVDNDAPGCLFWAISYVPSPLLGPLHVHTG